MPLDRFYLRWEILEDGYISATDSLLPGHVMPDDSLAINIKLQGINLSQAQKAGKEVMLNLAVCTKDASTWAKAGHTVAQQQYELLKRCALPQLSVKSSRKNTLKVEETPAMFIIKNAHIEASFDKQSGQMKTLILNGQSVISHSQGFVYDNHRWIENDKFTDTSNGLEPAGTCTLEKKGSSIIVRTTREGNLCQTQIIYTLLPDGTIDMDVELMPQTNELRRCGLTCAIDSSLNTVDYYAYGPWENYNDRKDGCTVGRYTTTVEQMEEKYVKPQSMGNREGLRELLLRNSSGAGIKIETEGNVSFSALRYTDEDLMNCKHMWELQKRPYIVLHLDAAVRGVGNASCGKDVDTLPVYRIQQQKYSYKLRISSINK